MSLQSTVQIPAHKIFDVKLLGSAGASRITLVDNANVLTIMPDFQGSLDGDNFELMSAEFMKKLEVSNADMTLRISTMQFNDDQSYIITDITSDKELQTISIDDFKEVDYHHFYDASMRCFDEATLRKQVNDNVMEVSQGALDSAGWSVEYYKAESVRNIPVLNAYELKSIKEHKRVDVFFPHTKTIGTLDFDQFGMQYEELTNIHILADEFHRVYGSQFARPNKLDIIYIGFLDQFFEISEVTDIKTTLNSILYYDCVLKFISDRQAVAKDTDILDISELIDSTDQGDMFTEKDQNPATGQNPSTFDHKTVLDAPFTGDDIIECTAKVWSMQKFRKARGHDIEVANSNCMYGIAWINEQWQKFKYINSIAMAASLDATKFAEIAKPDKLYFAKMAIFDQPLTTFNEKMYYTTPIVSRTLQPLELIELQEQVY